MSTITGNQLENAFKRVGFTSNKTTKKPRHKKFECRICGAPMRIIDNTNVMVCTNDDCHNKYIFDV